MKSKISFFNKTVFLKTFSRFRPIWITYLFALILMGPLTFFAMAADRTNMSYYETLLAGFSQGVIPVATMFFGILSAVTAFSFLFKSNRVDFYHSLPLSRTSLFVSNYLAGFCFTLIPNIIICLVMTPLFAARALSIPLIFKVLVLFTLAQLFFYSLAVFCVAICGNMPSAIFAYGLINFLVLLIYSLIMALCSTFLLGFAVNYPPMVWNFTPIIKMYMQMDYTETFRFKVFVVYAAVGVAITAAAYILYRIRKSECAGDLTAFKLVRYVFRYVFGLIGAYTLGMLLFLLLMQIFGIDGNSAAAGGMLALTGVIGAMIFYYVFEMLALKKFKVFKGSGKAVLPLAIAVILVSFVLSFDLLGYENRVPAVNRVKEVSFSYYGTEISSSDTDFINDVRNIHKALIASSNNDYVMYSYRAVEVEYDLGAGVTVKRSYSYPYDSKTVHDLLDKIISSDGANEYAASKMKAGLGVKNINVSAYIYSDYLPREYNDYVNGNALAEAIIADIEAGSRARLEWGIDEELTVNVNMWDPYLQVNNSFILTIDDSFTNTMAYLELVKNAYTTHVDTQVG